MTGLTPAVLSATRTNRRLLEEFPPSIYTRTRYTPPRSTGLAIVLAALPLFDRAP